MFFLNMYLCGQYQNVTSLHAMKISRGGIPRRRDRVLCGCYTTWLQEAPPLSSSPGVSCRGLRGFRPTMAHKTEVRAQVMLSARKPGSWVMLRPFHPQKNTPGSKVQRKCVCILFCKMQVHAGIRRPGTASVTKMVTGTREFRG